MCVWLCVLGVLAFGMSYLLLLYLGVCAARAVVRGVALLSSGSLGLVPAGSTSMLHCMRGVFCQWPWWFEV